VDLANIRLTVGSQPPAQGEKKEICGWKFFKYRGSNWEFIAFNGFRGIL